MASGLLPSFRVGQKELYLPTAQIAFLRSTTLTPNQARFRVPLNFSKLDLRDYLFHAYNIEILSVRSHVKQSRVQSGSSALLTPARNRWHRPKAQKYMTVELARPFVWPEEPEDYQEWNVDEAEGAEVEQEKFRERQGSLKDAWVDEGRRERMREQARELLEGRAKWRPGVSKSLAGVQEKSK